MNGFGAVNNRLVGVVLRRCLKLLVWDDDSTLFETPIFTFQVLDKFLEYLVLEDGSKLNSLTGGITRLVKFNIDNEFTKIKKLMSIMSLHKVYEVIIHFVVLFPSGK